MTPDRQEAIDFGETIGETIGGGLSGVLAQPEAPTLTLLAHPDLDRVGEYCVMAPLEGASRTTLISRLEPEFRPPRQGYSRPLADGRISRRTPLHVQWQADGGVDLEVDSRSPAVVVDGVALCGREAYGPARVRDGLVVELASRVVVLLHLSEGRAPAPNTHGLIGESDAIQNIRDHIDRYADETGIAVLVRGESGVGKELVAQALHAAGPRSERRCVSVNMGAVTKSLATSEIFGHVKGAFGGAIKDHPGYVGEAEGGTLFLDEIGETPLEVQAMLLRFLEDGSYLRVGSNQTRRADIRIVTATDAGLEEAVAEGRFKGPLYRRMAGCEISLVPLRERKDDIGRLLAHFVRREMIAKGKADKLAYHDGHTKPWLPTWIVTKLARYAWPGNVRELRDIARQLVIMSHDEAEARPGGTVAALLREVDTRLAAAGSESTDEVPSPPVRIDPRARRPSTLDEAEILAALRASDWEPTAAAEALGMSRTTLYERMKRSERIRLAQGLTKAEIDDALGAHDGDEVAAARALEVSLRGLRQRRTRLERKS